MITLTRALPIAGLALLGIIAFGAAPARAQCAQGLLANCPNAIGLGLNDKLWADQASLTPHTARAATPAQVLALAPQVFPMLSGITITGQCAGNGTNSIPLACSLPGTAITSGTIPAARLPLPVLGVGGVVQAFTAPPGQFLTAINTTGTVTASTVTSGSISDATPMTGLDISFAVSSGAAPVVTACGAGTLVANSTDYSGAVSGMTGSTCTVTYAASHTPKLNCSLTPTTGVAMGAVTSTTNFIAAGTVTGFGWSCL